MMTKLDADIVTVYNSFRIEDLEKFIDDIVGHMWYCNLLLSHF